MSSNSVHQKPAGENQGGNLQWKIPRYVWGKSTDRLARTSRWNLIVWRIILVTWGKEWCIDHHCLLSPMLNATCTKSSAICFTKKLLFNLFSTFWLLFCIGKTFLAKFGHGSRAKYYKMKWKEIIQLLSEKYFTKFILQSEQVLDEEAAKYIWWWPVLWFSEGWMAFARRSLMKMTETQFIWRSTEKFIQ